MTLPGEPPKPPAPSSQAITALVVGILGFVTCCFLLSPFAWYLAGQELKAIRSGRSPVEGEAIAKIAKVLGIVGTLMLAIALFWMVMGGLAVVTGLLSEMSK